MIGQFIPNWPTHPDQLYYWHHGRRKKPSNCFQIRNEKPLNDLKELFNIHSESCGNYYFVVYREQ